VFHLIYEVLAARHQVISKLLAARRGKLITAGARKNWTHYSHALKWRVNDQMVKINAMNLFAFNLANKVDRIEDIEEGQFDMIG